MALVRETGAGAVFFHHLYDAISMVRDQQVKAALRGAGVDAHTFNADLLYEPWQVLGDDGQVRASQRGGSREGARRGDGAEARSRGRR